MLEVMDSAVPCCAAVVQLCVVEWDTLSVVHGYLTAFVFLRDTSPFAARHYGLPLPSIEGSCLMALPCIFCSVSPCEYLYQRDTH